MRGKLKTGANVEAAAEVGRLVAERGLRTADIWSEGTTKVYSLRYCGVGTSSTKSGSNFTVSPSTSWPALRNSSTASGLAN